MKYKIKEDNINVTFYISYIEETGECSVIGKQNFESLPESQKDQFSEESFSFKHPNWKDISEFSSASTNGLMPIQDERIFDKFLIKYLLVSTSFFDVQRGKTEEDKREHVLNIDEFIGDTGIAPPIINFILSQIRSRI